MHAVGGCWRTTKRRGFSERVTIAFSVTSRNIRPPRLIPSDTLVSPLFHLPLVRRLPLHSSHAADLDEPARVIRQTVSSPRIIWQLVRGLAGKGAERRWGPQMRECFVISSFLPVFGRFFLFLINTVGSEVHSQGN